MIIARLRVAVWRVVPAGPVAAASGPEHIEQIVPYVGGRRGGNGRRRSIRSGITGLAVRTGQPSAGSRGNDHDLAYIEELKSRWGFTEQDARALTPGRYSFMAVPIYLADEVVGVVYFDSDQRDLFTHPEIGAKIVAACIGFNRYVEWRY